MWVDNFVGSFAANKTLSLNMDIDVHPVHANNNSRESRKYLQKRIKLCQNQQAKGQDQCNSTLDWLLPQNDGLKTCVDILCWSYSSILFKFMRMDEKKLFSVASYRSERFRTINLSHTAIADTTSHPYLSQSQYPGLRRLD